MTLLAPIAALVAAGIGGALLLVMYMLRLRRRPVRVSTILFWGDPAKDLEANVPLRMIRPAWTLVLQALAVTLLALALGRPVIDAPSASADRLYILLDVSASMGAADSEAGGPTRLERAKDQARRLIAGVGGLGGTRAMLITFATRAQGVTTMTADRGVLGAGLDAIQQTDEPADLDAALDLVASLISSQAGEGVEAASARVVVLSDGAFERGVAQSLAGATIDYRPIGDPDAPNLGIAAMAARRDDLDPARARVFVRVVSNRSQPTPLTLHLSIDGRELARRAIEVPAARPAGDATQASTPDGAEGDSGGVPSADDLRPDPAGETGSAGGVRPGEQAIALEFDRAEGGVLRVWFDRPDALPADDSAWVVMPPARRAAILLVAPVGGADFFVRGVLEELDASWLRVVDAPTFESPAGQELAGDADIIVFDRVRPSVAPSRPSISLGAGIPAPGLDADPAAPSAGPTGAVQWDRSHPALASVSLDALRVSRTLVLRPAPDAAVRTLALGRDAPLIVEGRDDAVRRLVVAFAASDSNWPVTPGFAVFLASAIEDLSSVAGVAQAWRAGEPISPRGLSGVPLELSDAQGRRTASGLGGVWASRAGVYTLRAASTEQPVAINAAGEFESMLEVAPDLRVGDQTFAPVAGARGAREVWSWFVLAAGVVLLAEWLVYLRIAGR